MVYGMNDLRILLTRCVIRPVVDAIEENLANLNSALCSLVGITKEDIWKVSAMFSTKRDFLFVFIGVEPIDHLEWLRAMLASMM